jgi:Leucine-rich repeat (LRR) protein
LEVVLLIFNPLSFLPVKLRKKFRIEKLKKITHLKAGGRYDNEWGIDDLSFLQELPLLKLLDLNNNQVSDISYLQSLTLEFNSHGGIKTLQCSGDGGFIF